MQWTFWLSLAILTALGLLEIWLLRHQGSDQDYARPSATPREIALASLPAALLMEALGWLGVWWQSYGVIVFVLLPTIGGFVAAWLLTRRRLRTTRDCSRVAASAVLLAGIGVVAFALEGLLCLLMALPLAIPLALLGGRLAFHSQGSDWLRRRSSAALLIVLLGTPVLMGAEAAVDPEPPLLEVRTEIVVNAPPDVVWPRVVSFPEIPEDREWLFRTGIAYPMRAEIHGHGAGALRRCVFSTGDFVEPIEIWDEPRLLRFAVTQSPPSLQELSPWGDIRPPHAVSAFQGEAGQFELRRLPGGRTLLVGTTWYRHDLRPASYWRLWSDALIHRIHRRVLRHIARLAEEDQG